jgi:hypothetical protein
VAIVAYGSDSVETRFTADITAVGLGLPGVCGIRLVGGSRGSPSEGANIGQIFGFAPYNSEPGFNIRGRLLGSECGIDLASNSANIGDLETTKFIISGKSRPNVQYQLTATEFEFLDNNIGSDGPYIYLQPGAGINGTGPAMPGAICELEAAAELKGTFGMVATAFSQVAPLSKWNKNDRSGTGITGTTYQSTSDLAGIFYIPRESFIEQEYRLLRGSYLFIADDATIVLAYGRGPLGLRKPAKLVVERGANVYGDRVNLERWKGAGGIEILGNAEYLNPIEFYPNAVGEFDLNVCQYGCPPGYNLQEYNQAASNTMPSFARPLNSRNYATLRTTVCIKHLLVSFYDTIFAPFDEPTVIFNSVVSSVIDYVTPQGAIADHVLIGEINATGAESTATIGAFNSYLQGTASINLNGQKHGIVLANSVLLGWPGFNPLKVNTTGQPLILKGQSYIYGPISSELNIRGPVANLTDWRLLMRSSPAADSLETGEYTLGPTSDTSGFSIGTKIGCVGADGCGED